MTRRRALAALIAAAAAAAAGRPAAATDIPIVRVGIVLDQPVLRLDADAPLRALDLLGGASAMLVGGPWDIVPAADGMGIGGSVFRGIVRLTTPAGIVRVNGQPYRGAIEIRRTPGGRLTAIDELDLERYLYGVIKGEIDPHWPAEAVKAQAVAARTLALHTLAEFGGKFAGEGYTLRATTDSQVYLGMAGEDRGATEAVDATRGIVMLFRGEPIFAAYHSNSGGHTEDSENVWGAAHPYLRGVPDPYALDAPGAQWTARVPLSAIDAAIRRAGIALAGAAAVEPGRVTPWGRVVTLRIGDEAGRWLEMNANQFRLLLGPAVLRSTMFAISRAGNDVLFTGRGSGHGVGLDQWGARALALRGYTFEQILAYYYTGVTLERRY
jgi:stage II sporulation protein D